MGEESPETSIVAAMVGVGSRAHPTPAEADGGSEFQRG
jgi:hypothetical protein